MNKIHLNEILLDRVSYSRETGLISYTTAYSYDSTTGKIERLGVWRREEVINVIKQGQKVTRGDISMNALKEYIAQAICYINIKEIDGKFYLKNTDYPEDLEKDDMIEMNRLIRREKLI